nr:Uncharacterised protein [Streptococcus thermophilus]
MSGGDKRTVDVRPALDNAKVQDKPESEENFDHEAIGKGIVDAVWNENFGTATKAQYEQLLFHLFVQNGENILGESDFAIAQKLGCTPAKVSGLRYSHFQRLTRGDSSGDAGNGLVRELSRHVTIDLDTGTDEEKTTLYIREKYWRDLFKEEAYGVGTFTDTSFNRERIVVSTESLRKNFWLLFSEPSSWQVENWSEKYGPDRKTYNARIEEAKKALESPGVTTFISVASLMAEFRSLAGL